MNWDFVRGSAHLARARVVGDDHLRARKVLGWPERCKSAHAFLWEHSDKKAGSGPTSGTTSRLAHLDGVEAREAARRRGVELAADRVLEDALGHADLPAARLVRHHYIYGKRYGMARITRCLQGDVDWMRGARVGGGGGQDFAQRTVFDERATPSPRQNLLIDDGV